MLNNGTSSGAQSQGERNDGGNKKEQQQQQERVSAPQLVPVRNAYLDEIARRIKGRPIPWEGYARAELVSDDELKMIRAADNSIGRGNEPSGIDDEATALQGDKYTQLYIRLLAKLTRTDTLQQILVMMGDMLRDHDERVKHFAQAKAQDKGNSWPWQPLVKLLDIQDDFCQLKAAQLLTLFLVSPELPTSSTPSYVLDRLLAFLSSLLHAGGSGAGGSNLRGTSGSGALMPPSGAGGFAEGNGADVAIQLLEALLRSIYYRKRIWKDEMRKLGQVLPDPDDEDEEQGDEEEGNKGKDDATYDADTVSEQRSLLAGLRAILGSTLSPKASPYSTQDSSSSGTSTPSGSSSSRGANDRYTALLKQQKSSGSQTPVGTVGVQMVYQVGFCFWLLSFDKSIASDLNDKFGIVPVLADVARNAIKEKVIRVIVATFRNLIEKAPSANLSAMLGARVLPLMDSLAGRKWSDDEIKEDVDFIKSSLQEKLKVMSTYDTYISELASGRLTWENPVHDQDDFWKHNTQRLLEAEASEDFHKGSGLEMLLDLLKPEDMDDEKKGKDDGKKNSDQGQDNKQDDDRQQGRRQTAAPANSKGDRDATTLAIACNDIGRMLQASSSDAAVRKRIDKLGGKVYIMALMEHEDGQVKFQALKTVSKLVSASWRS